LEELDASINELQAIPLELSELHNLTLLDLSHNSLTQFTISLPPKLKSLTLSFNGISTIGSELNSPVLEIFHYQRNNVIIFPSQILHLRALKLLNLCGNRLNYMPDEIDQLALLENLDLSENSFSSLPPSLFRLTSLTLLNIGKNTLGSLPRDLEALTGLENLYAPSCSLKEIHFNIATFTSLTELNLRENSIVHFSKSCSAGFEYLTNLRTLDLSYNGLVYIPRQIGYLTRLRKLLLNNNNIRNIPGEFNFFPPSIDITLSSNPFDYPFSQYLNEGIPMLLDNITTYMKAYAPKCTLVEDISQVPAGKALSAKLVSMDFAGKPRISSGDEFKGSMVCLDNSSLQLDVFIKNDKGYVGQYDVYFSCPPTGTMYQLSITFEDIHIKGSPFSIKAL